MKTPTDQQLNIAMCKWMGWQKETDSHEVVMWRDPSGRLHDRHIPPVNYLSDDSPRRLLNEAEAKLGDVDQWHYQCDLFLIICGRKEGKFTHKECFAVRSANARQRVIGILRVVQPELFL